MKKVCGIDVEDFATVKLVGERRDMTPKELRRTLNSQYHPFVTKDYRGGVLVYMSQEEYERKLDKEKLEKSI